MLSLILKLAEFGIGKFYDSKAKNSNDKLEIRKIDADKEKALIGARAYVLGQGAWRFQKVFIYILAMYWISVVLYSMFWCNACIIPYAGLDYEWSIAALPEPFDIWATGIMTFLFLMGDKK